MKALKKLSQRLSSEFFNNPLLLGFIADRPLPDPFRGNSWPLQIFRWIFNEIVQFYTIFPLIFSIFVEFSTKWAIFSPNDGQQLLRFTAPAIAPCLTCQPYSLFHSVFNCTIPNETNKVGMKLSPAPSPRAAPYPHNQLHPSPYAASPILSPI